MSLRVVLFESGSAYVKSLIGLDCLMVLFLVTLYQKILGWDGKYEFGAGPINKLESGCQRSGAYGVFET